MLSDRKTPATEEQLELKESKIIEFEKREYLAQHIIFLTTSAQLGAKIKDMSTAEEMWKTVKDDGSVIADTCFKIIIMSSLPDSYCPTLQTITTAEKATRLSGSMSKGMLPNDLITFIIEEAQHQVINDKCTKTAESALATHTKNVARPRGKGKNKSKNMQSDVTCDNCNAPSHSIMDCWSKGGGKEGQGPGQKNKKDKQPGTAVVAVKDDKNELFTFTCMYL